MAQWKELAFLQVLVNQVQVLQLAFEVAQEVRRLPVDVLIAQPILVPDQPGLLANS